MNKNIKKVVYKILQEDNYARCNDNYLIVRVAQELEPNIAGSKFIDLRFSKLSLEGITRARRSFFKENPELKIDKVEKSRRKEEQEYYLEYARKY